MRIGRWPTELWLGFRSLRRAPVSTTLSVAALALGLGGALAFVTAVRVLWLAPLPYPDPARLVSVSEISATGTSSPTSMLTVADWRAQATAFARLGGARSQTFLVAAEGAEPRVETVGQVTEGFLEAIGIAPVAGRLFGSEELRDGARVAVVSERLAIELFGNVASAAGSVLTLNDVAHVVVGVLAGAFEFPVDGRIPRAWTPIDGGLYGARRTARALTVVGRLEADASAPSASAQVAAAMTRLAAGEPEMRDRTAAVVPLHSALRGAGSAPLTLLGVAAGLFLLTAAGNVAGLQLERALHREREIGIRLALGAGGIDLVRQLGGETLLLCGAGLTAALALSSALLAMLPALFELTGGLPPLLRLEAHALQTDAVAASIAVVITALLGAALTLLPVAVLGRRDAAGLLRRDPDGSGRNGRRALVVAQVALSVVLVLGAGLLVRSLANLAGENPGFSVDGVSRFGLGIPEARYSTEPQQIDLHRRVVEELLRLPGVTEAGLVARLPLGGVPAFGTSFEAANLPPGDPDRAPRTRINVASAGFFRALGIPLLRGRLVDWGDGPDATRALVVSAVFAERHLPSDPLGARIRLGFRSAINPPGTEWEVVGVVGDLRQASLGEAPEPTVYLPASQFPLDGGSYVLSGPAPDEVFAGAVRDAIWRVDPGLQEVRVGAMRERLDGSLAEPRATVAFGAAFAALALLLTCLGIYGALAVETVRRRRELAIRLALGASPARTVGLVLETALVLAAAGAAVGLPAGWQLAALLESRLHAVRSIDPLTSLGVVGLLLLVAAAAAALPAVRAARVSPIETIRRA